MNNNGAGYPAFLSVCQKCFAEFAAGMAANNLDYFLPRHVRGKKYFARRECFFAHLWAKKRKRQTYPRIERPPSQLLLIEMAVNYF